MSSTSFSKSWDNVAPRSSLRSVSPRDMAGSEGISTAESPRGVLDEVMDGFCSVLFETSSSVDTDKEEGLRTLSGEKVIVFVGEMMAGAGIGVEIVTGSDFVSTIAGPILAVLFSTEIDTGTSFVVA